MIAKLIRWSLANRFLVLLITGLLVAAGVYAVARTPLDAIPDLSDVQVIIKTSYPGQAPQVVEDQVTYPLATAMLSVPGAVTVRGYSMFGDSFVYIIFKDGTDIYWARSRVLEYLSQVIPRLPRAAKPALGPDATGVGWIYEYALVDRSGKARSVSASCDPGLVPEIRAAHRAGRVRGRRGRRHGQAVPDRRRSGEAARLPADAAGCTHGSGERQPGIGRRGDRAGRGRVHDPRARLRAGPERPARDPARRHLRRRADPPRTGRRDPPGARDAPRHHRAERRGRGRGRHHRHALRRERACHHRGGEAETR